MKRRTACIGFLAIVTTTFLSRLAAAAQAVARIAGPRWNVNGDWTPTLEEVQGHLRSVHGIEPGSMGLEDLLALHDNDHNRRGSLTTHSHRKSTKNSSKGFARF